MIRKFRSKKPILYNNSTATCIFLMKGANTDILVLKKITRDRATYFCFESWDSMILLVRSHQNFWRSPVKLDLWEQVSWFASQGCITNSKVHFLGSTLRKNAQFFASTRSLITNQKQKVLKEKSKEVFTVIKRTWIMFGATKTANKKSTYTLHPFAKNVAVLKGWKTL